MWATPDPLHMFAGIAVSSVVEKGSKDEMLLLSNSGRVRIKSAFILTEEERAKIAAMVSHARPHRNQHIISIITSQITASCTPTASMVAPHIFRQNLQTQCFHVSRIAAACEGHAAEGAEG